MHGRLVDDPIGSNISMRLLVLLTVIALAVAAQAQPAPRVYVSVEEASTVAVVDPLSLRITTRVRVGSNPHNLTALGQGLVVVANWGSRFISVLDPANLRRARSIPVRVRPHDVTGSSDGKRVYVASEDRAVLFVDLVTGRIMRAISIGRRPHDLIEVGTSVWVTDIAAPAIYLLDARNGTRLATLVLPSPGHDIAVRPDGKEVLVRQRDRHPRCRHPAAARDPAARPEPAAYGILRGWPRNLDHRNRKLTGLRRRR